MRIYRVAIDVNNFQSLYVDPDKWDGDLLSLLTFDCTRRASTWIPPPVFVLQPKLRRGNFLDLQLTSTIVMDELATEQLGGYLEICSELLPLPFKDEMFHVLNVTECVDVLDEENTEWIYGRSTNARIGIRRHAFFPSRLTEAPLFKIPQMGSGDVLTVEGLKDPEDEFKGQVELCGLTGLIFKEIWKDGDHSRS